jgi:hypothetical protein
MTDNKQTITILGEQIDIRFCMAVEIAYEEIAGEPFSIESLNRQKNSVALYMAAIITANPDTKITIERLMTEASGAEIGQLATAVIESMTQWMHIPDVLPKEDQSEKKDADDEDKTKN